MNAEYDYMENITRKNRACAQRMMTSLIIMQVVILLMLAIAVTMIVIAAIYLLPLVTAAESAIDNINSVASDTKNIIAGIGGPTEIELYLEKVKQIINRLCYMLKC